MNLELNTEPKNWQHSALWLLIAALMVLFTTTALPLAHEIGDERQLQVAEITLGLSIAGAAAVFAVVNLFLDDVPSERRQIMLYCLAFIIILTHLLFVAVFLEELGYISGVILEVVAWLLLVAVVAIGSVSVYFAMGKIFGKIRYQGP